MSANNQGSKMSKHIEKMLSKTEGLRSTAEISQAEAPSPVRMKTAIGTMAALSAAQERIKELEAGRGTMLPLAALQPNPWQPRKVFNETGLRELADSIAEVGLLQPILVRVKSVTPGDTSGQLQYEIVAGERRVRAHQMLGRTDISAVVGNISDADMAVVALAENMSREDLSDYEVGKALRKAEAEFASRKKMAEAIGCARQDLYRYFAFQSLPARILADLEIDGTLISRKTAEALKQLLVTHGERAERILLEIWPRVAAGALDHPRLPGIVETSIQRGAAVQTDRDIRKLFIGKRQVGSITRDHKAFTLKVKAADLSQEAEDSLRTFVNQLFQDPQNGPAASS